LAAYGGYQVNELRDRFYACRHSIAVLRQQAGLGTLNCTTLPRDDKDERIYPFIYVCSFFPDDPEGAIISEKKLFEADPEYPVKFKELVKLLDIAEDEKMQVHAMYPDGRD
jgi:hypothetical protein